MLELPSEAVEILANLFDCARTIQLSEPMAATLATVAPDGQPSARIVLIRGFDKQGFVFYTNTESRKGRQLQANPRAALCMFWDQLHRQVRAEGSVERVGDALADEYWKTRPRDSQLGAWASDQSQPLDDMSTLEARIVELEERYAGQEVPRPPHWTGYRIRPHRIEFWSRGDARLHQRYVYEVHEGTWSKGLLFP